MDYLYRDVLKDIELLVDNCEIDLHDEIFHSCDTYIDEYNRIHKELSDSNIHIASFKFIDYYHGSTSYQIMKLILLESKKMKHRLQSALGISSDTNNSETLPIRNVNNDYMHVLEHIFVRFHLVVRQLRRRHSNRSTLDVEDEYDVQDLLHSLLRLYFLDIRTEEWTPSYAGSAKRMDFILKEEKVVIEVKMTRKGLTDREIGEQLLVDIETYKEHRDCETLVCFVYDPAGRIVNPIGLENDLAKQSKDNMKVKAHIFPK